MALLIGDFTPVAAPYGNSRGYAGRSIVMHRQTPPRLRGWPRTRTDPILGGSPARRHQQPLGVDMGEPKPTATFSNRRLQNRFAIPAEANGILQFRYPGPNGRNIEVRLRDLSLSGLSLTLPEEMTGVQPGDIVKAIEARVASKTFRGDLLVMHVSPANETGAVCGGLFYPEGDEDLITIRLVVRALEAASRSIS
jgi:hypothetical protein